MKPRSPGCSSGPAGEVDEFRPRPARSLEHGRDDAGRHQFGARRRGAEVTVGAGLVAAQPEIDLQDFEGGGGQGPGAALLEAFVEWIHVYAPAVRPQIPGTISTTAPVRPPPPAAQSLTRP
jgi:hypothetical protein